MSALEGASALCASLKRHHISYQLIIARDDALMVCITIPGQRWEVEFFDDGQIELERFVSQGVEDAEDLSIRLRPFLD